MKMLGILLMTILVACAPSYLSTVKVHEGNPDNGRTLYTMCANCHEPSVHSESAPELVGSTIIWNDKWFMKIVWEGRSLTLMPAWRWTLTPQEIKDIQKYLQVITEEELSHD